MGKFECHRRKDRCTPEGVLAYYLGLLEQWPQLRLLRLLCGCEVFIQAQLGPARPLRPHNTAWRSLLVANLSSIVPRRAPATEVQAHVIAGSCRMATMTLARSLIQPYNSFMLNCYTNVFYVSSSLASKLVRCRLNLRSSCLGASTRVSTAQLTT